VTTRAKEKNCDNIVRFYHCETEQNGQTRGRRIKKKTKRTSEGGKKRKEEEGRDTGIGLNGNKT
jgi:hypothetical protein